MDAPTPTAPADELRARRVRFHYPIGTRFQHYVDGDLIMSHAVAVLSGMFPEGEDFFVRAVRDHRQAVTDPVLQQQVAGFIGQEVSHGREHRKLNQNLAEMGYRSTIVDRHVRRLLAVVDRIPPGIQRLGVTAALEHYTATLAEILLSDPEAQRLLGDGEARSLLMWHALEESEHKAVAFDVYRAAGGPEWLRITVMRTTTAIFLLEVIGHTVLSMLHDPATYRPRVLLASLRTLRRSPFVQPAVWRRLRSYNRRGFHPHDWDATELTTHWRTELFGEHGSLVDHLR